MEIYKSIQLRFNDFDRAAYLFILERYPRLKRLVGQHDYASYGGERRLYIFSPGAPNIFTYPESSIIISFSETKVIIIEPVLGILWSIFMFCFLN